MTGGIDTCFYCPREIYREGLCQTCYSETDEDEFARPDADEPCDLCMTNLDEQDLCPNCEPGSVYVAVYEVTRNFGGHEEGGWWYDAGERILLNRFPSLEMAGEYADHLREGDYPKTGKRYSVLGGDDYDVEIWDGEIPPKYFPEERPYYE